MFVCIDISIRVFVSVSSSEVKCALLYRSEGKLSITNVSAFLFLSFAFFFPIGFNPRV